MELAAILIIIVISVIGLYLLWATYDNSQEQNEINLRLIDIQETIGRRSKSSSDTLVPISFLMDLYRSKVISQFEFRLYLEQFYGFDVDAEVIPDTDTHNTGVSVSDRSSKKSKYYDVPEVNDGQED